MPELKQMVKRYLQSIAAIIVVLILCIAMAVQILSEQQRAYESANGMLYQVQQILEENQKDLVEVRAEYVDTCLHNAETIAYMIEHQPALLESVDELRTIARMLEIDEIHIFDKTGRIFMGTHPEYFDLTFDSGEQIGFFKPMLQDKMLRLCQEIVPNTAESKMMQYSALWSESGEYIVQVGMNPVTVMEVTKKNELSYIFSLLRVSINANFYAIDGQNGEIVGATFMQDVGKNAADIGLDLEEVKNDKDGFHEYVNGVNSYCVFIKMDDNYVGRIVSNDLLYQRITANTLTLALCLILIAIILVHAVTKYMSRYVIDDIENINEKLRRISEGNLDEEIENNRSKEFYEFANHINEMKKSLLAGTDKISYILNKTDMHIGVYEYNDKMKKVRITEHVPELLNIQTDVNGQLSVDYALFKECMNNLMEHPVAGEEGIYCPDGAEVFYVKVEESIVNNDTFGIVMDVTEEIIKRRKIEKERDIDLLTGLFNRRGLEDRLTALYKRPEQLRCGALIMVDADGLKGINDQYGHDKGDVYLKKLAGVLLNFGLKKSITARLGGDEFVLFIYDYDDEDEVMNTIKTLEYIQNNSTARLAEEISVPLAFSFGYAMIKGTNEYQSLIKEADEKMYENKRERKVVRA